MITFNIWRSFSLAKGKQEPVVVCTGQFCKTLHIVLVGVGVRQEGPDLIFCISKRRTQECYVNLNITICISKLTKRGSIPPEFGVYPKMHKKGLVDTLNYLQTK